MDVIQKVPVLNNRIAKKRYNHTASESVGHKKTAYSSGFFIAVMRDAYLEYITWASFTSSEKSFMESTYV